MSTFADYAYYRENGGRLGVDQYESHVKKAYLEIMDKTLGRARNAPDEMKDAVRKCECALVDIYADYTDVGISKGVSSINNDGLSVTYRASAQRDERRERAGVCRIYLTQPVNLLCRWT